MKIVISLGGSVIIPDKVDLEYLNKFKKTILKLKKKHQIVIVTGGGSIARTYIDALKKDNLDNKTLSHIGIFTTRLNARLVAAILNIKHVPSTEKELKKIAKRERLIVTGALGFHPNMTSDGTAAEAALHLKADLLINITNVPGLFTKDPRKFKDAKQIPRISFKDFDRITKKIKFKAGQHFVLDQSAADIIYKSKIPTAIVTKDIKNLERLIQGKNFKGTLIS
jgi:uridylate kinase